MSRIDLKHTPFTILSKDNDKVPDYLKSYIIARSDNRQALCIGAFGASDIADTYRHGEEVYLYIRPDGTALEYNAPIKADPLNIIKFTDNDSVIVMAKPGECWQVPYGFAKWAKGVFTNQLTSTQ